MSFEECLARLEEIVGERTVAKRSLTSCLSFLKKVRRLSANAKKNSTTPKKR